MIRMDDDHSDAFAYATVTVREPVITGVRITSSFFFRGTNNALSVVRDTTGPLSTVPVWEFSIVSPGLTERHPETEVVYNTILGRWDLNIHQNEDAERITVRVTLKDTDWFGEFDLTIIDF